MAKTKHKASSKHRSAGSHKKRRNAGRRATHRRRSNPGSGMIKDWLSLGLGAVGGSAGATWLPQQFFASSNNGIFGYGLNLAATGVLAWLAHAFVKQPSVTAGVVAGGVGATIRRVIQDNTLLGQYTSAVTGGMGDIITDFNFSAPQTVAGIQGRSVRNPWGGNPYGPAAAPVAAVPVNVGGAGMGATLY